MVCALSGLASHWEDVQVWGEERGRWVEKWKHRAGGVRRLSWREGLHLEQWAANACLRDTVGWRGYCHPENELLLLIMWNPRPFRNQPWPRKCEPSGWRNSSCLAGVGYSLKGFCWEEGLLAQLLVGNSSWGGCGLEPDFGVGSLTLLRVWGQVSWAGRNSLHSAQVLQSHINHG